MIKRTIKETVREYDADGKVVRETVTEKLYNDKGRRIVIKYQE